MTDLQMPSPDDVPRAPADAFGIIDGIDAATGKTVIMLAIQSNDTWRAYTISLAETRKLHDLLGDELDRHAHGT